jgi:hypothetical protein
MVSESALLVALKEKRKGSVSLKSLLMCKKSYPVTGLEGP